MKKSASIISLALLAAACGSGSSDDAAGGGGAGNEAGQDAGGGGSGGEAGGSGGAGGEIEPLVCDGPGARFITDVVSVSYGEGQDFGRDEMPGIVFGPPLGGGEHQGSLDVVSLGNGGEIVVAFAGNAVVDGDGIDFVVFENAFMTGSAVFAELATVAVSDDGSTWHEFPCSAVEAPYDSCAGKTPVYLDGDPGPIDPATSGGDAFDLADLGVEQARFVRITDRVDLDGDLDGVFDLDAAGIVHAACE